MNANDVYKGAGVDIDAGNEAASRYAGLAKRATRSEVIGGLGGFSGGFALDVQKYPQPVLVSGADGVGTKLKIAYAAGKHDTIGIDCVAMCVNDILTCGAEPLFFLDYLGVNKLDVDIAEEIVRGVAEGCSLANCALVGGETAELGDVYAPGEYDLAGTAVGVVNASDRIDGSTITDGDVVIGLASNGVHSNGYSLVRKLVADAGLAWDDVIPGWRGTVAAELLTPTRIYVRSILSLMEQGLAPKGMAHITGGGLVDNIPRTLPITVGVRLNPGSWPVQPVFSWLREQSGMDFTDACRVWNMGIGYVLVVAPEAVQPTLACLSENGETAYVIGEAASNCSGVVWET